jgi:hypothetical protein
VTQARATFIADYKNASLDVRRGVDRALQMLQKNPQAKSLRLHRMKWGGLSIFKIDVFSNHSWQISFELENETVTLRRLARHKDMDREL